MHGLACGEMVDFVPERYMRNFEVKKRRYDGRNSGLILELNLGHNSTHGWGLTIDLLQKIGCEDGTHRLTRVVLFVLRMKHTHTCFSHVFFLDRFGKRF